MLTLWFIALLAAPASPPPPPAPAPDQGGAPQTGDAAPATPGGEGAPAPDGEAPPPDDDAGSEEGGVTYYQFSGLGIDGELRTPALLQFLSRIGGEFETVGIPHRSFMPELRQTVMEDAL